MPAHRDGPVSSNVRRPMETPAAFNRYKNAVAKLEGFCLEQATAAIVDGKKTEQVIAVVTSTLILGFHEIEHALERLELLESLFSAPPPISDRIPNNTYLNFLIGAHLQEIYILEQRLSTYAKKVSRAYKRNFNGDELSSSVRNQLEQVIKIRGEHVHSARFTDRRLDLIAGISMMGDFAIQLGINAEAKYAEVQSEWQQRILKINSEVSKLLSNYFTIMLTAITTDQQIVLPRIGRNTAPLTIALDA